MLYKQDDKSERQFTRRAFFIGALQAIGLCILGGRLAWLQIAQGTRYKTLSDKNRINIKILSPLRGEIVDRFGVPLAVNTQNYRVLIIPEQVKDIEGAIKKLQKIIDVSEYDINRAMKEVSRNAKFIPIKIKEDLTWEEVAKIEVNLPDLPGLSIDVGDIRNYPYKDTTAHVIGYVRAVSVKDLENNNNPALRLPGVKIGKTGIERVHEDELRGKAGTSEIEVNVIGREVRELKRHESISGKRVTLTIDGELQRYTQEVLSTHKSASAVIMDAHTGAIYAMASHPSFDPNAFVRGLSIEEWEVIRDDPTKPQTNKTIAGQYPPGSTFKMITALAGLKAGVIDKNTTVFCPGHYQLGNGKFHCWKKAGHGRVDLQMALEQSCDTYFYKMSTEVGIDKIAEMSRHYGLGQKLGIELLEEAEGLIPDQKWKRAAIGEKWQPGESVVASIGQGYILTTPLQLAVMTARLANGGKAVKPWLTGYIGGQQMNMSQEWPDMNMNPAHIKEVLKGMERVVNSPRGTAQASRIDQEGFEMAGKTGTAQVRRITKEQRRLGVKNQDLPWEQRHHALFVGYAPISNPRYVCSVVVEHGVGGSSAAAPLAKLLLEQTQARDPAKTNMRPEVINNEDILRSWPPRKPDEDGVGIQGDAQ
ncbi:MAG: penicillin-binding protein 2 [Alphaproteobacteria bacterium]